MIKTKDTSVPETKASSFNLARYAIQAAVESVAGRRKREQQNRMNSYFVKLPLHLFAVPIHRPVTQIVVLLYFEAALARSPIVTASYQRAKRLVGLNCSRKTFYRALNQLEAIRVLTKTHVNGRAIEVTLNGLSTRTEAKNK